MTQSGPEARVQRSFSARPEVVFDALLDPASIPRWMFGDGPDADEVVRIEVQVRLDGRFSFLVRRDGMDIDHVGRYLELDRPNRLVFTWAATVPDELADESQVEITIAPAGAGSELTLIHHLRPNWADFAPQAADSWGRMLDRLVALTGR